MALVLANRVQETATPNTTVSFTLTGAVVGFQSFAIIGNGNTTYYSATDSSGNWEVGVGLYLSTGTILVRNTISESSNSGSAVTFSGVVNVFVTLPSGSAVYEDASGNVSALGTVSSGTWQGSTIGVAYGGTGVTTSSGPNSVVLRDANENITVNRLSQGLQTITASGGVTTLTAASDFNQQLVGTGGHTFRLPDATTLTDTTTFQFNNNATGTLTIQNNAGTAVGTVASGGAAGIALMNNSTVGGTWDVHGYIPESVTWGTNALALGSTVITGGTWNGGTIQSGYGGTGLTTFAGANNALYSTSASALAAGTLPVAAGGTGNTSGQAATVANAATFNNSGSGAASGSTYNGGSALTVSYNTIGAPSTTGTNASGTWGINVTGNAATATSATTATTANALNTANNYQVNSLGVGTSSTIAGQLKATTAIITPGVNGVSQGFNVINGDITTYRSGGTTGVIYLSNSGSSYLYWDGSNYQMPGGQLYVNSNLVLTAGNYNSYAPTLTGTGASGTWGINISGNAATATTATNQSGGTVNATTGAFSSNLTSNRGIANDATGSLRIFAPGGASYATGASTVTGAIKIRIPAAALGSNTMMSFKVKIYQYSGGLSAELQLGGYNYNDASYTWYNVSATNISQSIGDLTVRFGYDGTSQCVYIGALASVWYYPQVVVTDFFGGYNAYTTAMWSSGWSISFESSAFAGVTNTTTAYATLSSGNYNSYAPTLTGSGASGTWGINVTGNAATATSATSATTASTAANANLLNNLSSTQLFNNMGQNHTTYADANSFTNFGTQYLNGTTNGPGASGTQWYMIGMGLGNDYAYSSYAMQVAIPRTPVGGNPYVSVRYREGGTWNSWAKIYAGFADTAGTITSQANSATITASTTATANQIVLRDVNADDFRRYGYAEYFNMSHGASGTTTDTIFYSSSDNFIRKNNATGFRASLNVPTRTGGDASGTWGINISGNAANTSSISSAVGTSYTWTATQTLGTGTSLIFTGASTPNYSISQGTETIGGSTTNALFLRPTGVSSANVVIAALTVSNAALWLRPNSTGSGVGIVGTINDLDVALRRNQNNYIYLGASNAISTVIQGGTAGTTYPAYFARAWVNFNGTGTVAIRGSGNVTSITDNGVGDYTINFTTAMPDVNYSATSIGPSIGNSGGAFQVAQNTAATPTTSAYRLNVQTVGGTMTDNAYVSLVFFR